MKIFIKNSKTPVCSLNDCSPGFAQSIFAVYLNMEVIQKSFHQNKKQENYRFFFNYK